MMIIVVEIKDYSTSTSNRIVLVAINMPCLDCFIKN